MSENKRKLVTVRRIDNIEPIEGADAIVVATVEGWKVVVKKGEFNVGDQCVYFEIDSFLPEGNPAWQFLVDKQGREFEGVRGHRLRTVKLRGQISQGFVVPVKALSDIDLVLNGRPEYEDLSGSPVADEISRISQYLTDGGDVRDIDFSEILGVKKWEAALPAELAGQAEGLFPSFIRKTDQERCQNLVSEIFGYEDTLVEIDTASMSEEALTTMREKGLLELVDGKWMKINRAKANRDTRFEISMKLDGSSCTAFARQRFTEPVQLEDGTFEIATENGVCSRNLQLKINEANAENTFVKVAMQSGLLGALEDMARDGREYAVQGELMGPGIQGNREDFKTFKLFVFDIFDINTGKQLAPNARIKVFRELYEAGVNPSIVFHVPVLNKNGQFTDPVQDDSGWALHELDLNNIQDLLAFAEGPSLNHLIREGVVFKSMDGQFSFKAISNKFLLKGGD